MRNTAAVLGSPISHSLSPLIHNYVYDKLKIDAEYIAVEVKEAEFITWITKALTESEQWFGFSLTMPLKEVVCSTQLSEIVALDPVAVQIKSANTLYLESGRWRATSTDVIGIYNLLKSRNFNRVVILGAGGTARAAVAALDRISSTSQIEVVVYRRSSRRDDALRNSAQHLNIEIRDWQLLASEKHIDLLINTVPNDGIAPIVDEIGLCNLVLDAIYTPWMPALTERQVALGGEVISGLDFLAAQALPQIQLMTGKEFDDSLLYKELIAKLYAAL